MLQINIINVTAIGRFTNITPPFAPQIQPQATMSVSHTVTVAFVMKQAMFGMKIQIVASFVVLPMPIAATGRFVTTLTDNATVA